MSDSLNARMAEALAPVLEEEAVYDRVWVCSFGHVETGYLRDWNDADARLCRASVGNHWGGCRAPARKDKRPKDFADPAVGWGLWERWAHPRGHAFEAAPDLAPDRWIVGIPDLQEDLGFTATGSGVLEALLGAWSAALGLEGSGDA